MQRVKPWGVWRTVEPITSEALRRVQSPRVFEHRTVLRERLRTYGATAIANLDEKYFRDYYRFLLTLEP